MAFKLQRLSAAVEFIVAQVNVKLGKENLKLCKAECRKSHKTSYILH